MAFGDMREQFTNDHVNKVWCEFLTDIAMLAVIVTLLQSNTGQIGSKSDDCGIPVLMWLDVFFLIFAVRSLGNLLKIYVIRNYSTTGVIYYDVIKLTVIFLYTYRPICLLATSLGG